MPPPSDIEIRPLLLGDGWYLEVPGGLNRYLAGLYDALTGAGMKPEAVIIGPGEGAPPGFISAGKHSSPLLVRLLAFKRAAARAGGPNLVDAHFAIYSYLPVVFSRLRRLPLVVHFQGPWADESRVESGRLGVRSTLKRSIEGTLYRRAGQLITLSAAFRQILVERYRVSPWDVSVVPPGVELDRFVPGDKFASRKALEVPEAVRVVVAVRRLVRRVGLDVLLRAWPTVFHNVPGALLLVVGDGPERNALERLAEAEGVASSVRFLGEVDESRLVDCYRSADLAVVPSTALEGYGLSVLEALACGVPVVASDVGGLPEAVAPLDPGLIVPAGDVAALAESISSLLTASRPAPSPQECRTYAETFTWQRAADRHAAIYRRTIEPGSRSPRVVFVDHCAELSGGEIAMLGLLQAFEDVQTHVILGEDGPLVPRLLQAGLSVEVLPLNPRAGRLRRRNVTPRAVLVGALFSSALYTLKLARRLRRLRPDIVHANSLKAGFYGLAAARLAGVPGVWHVRDRIADDYLPPFAVRLVRFWAGTAASAVITNSRATSATLPSNRERAVIPSPVHLTNGVVKKRGPTEGDETLTNGVAKERGPVDKPKRPFKVGMVGRLQPWKGQDVFLRAFAEAFPDGDSRAVLVGSAMFGEERYEDELRRLAVELGIEDRVYMKGFRSDVAAELAELDVLVHASIIPEPFGQVVVEGMAAGLPVVASAGGGPLESITDEVDGLLYPPGDWHALAERLLRLSDDDDLRVRLGNAGIARSRDFAPDKIAEKVTGVYRRMLGDRWPGQG